jgi:N-acetylglucosamine-6-phosphate deacetylase
MSRIALSGCDLFDGARMHPGAVLLVEDGHVTGIAGAVPEGFAERWMDGIVSPGFVDLQVNGGDGVMLGEAPDATGLARIARAHRALGVRALLPTLITDRPEITAAAVRAVAGAAPPGVVGLHLEGPHLSPARAGAHEPALIRPMEDADEAFLIAAAARLPVLKVTLAPEVVGPERIARLAAAGVVVSLGHSDCDYETAMAAVRAGARCVTHLFNAMSPLGHRMPGLAGAGLDADGVHAGIIADGVHVHPAALRVALAARAKGLFLVSDAMAVAGTADEGFTLNGRQVLRRDGRLTLADGTLAGADLDLLRAMRLTIREGGASLERALAMATSVPAGAVGLTDAGRLLIGEPLDALLIDRGLTRVEALTAAALEAA